MPMVGAYFPQPKCHGIQWLCHYHTTTLRGQLASGHHEKNTRTFYQALKIIATHARVANNN